MNEISKSIIRTATLVTCFQIIKDLTTLHKDSYLRCYVQSNIDISPQNINRLNDRIKRIIKLYVTEDRLSEFLSNREFWYDFFLVFIRDLSVFNVMVRNKFYSDRKFIKESLCSLGYSDYYNDIINGDFYYLYDLVFTFGQNMTPELQHSLISNGIDEELINRLLSYTEKLLVLKDCFGDTNNTDSNESSTAREIYSIYLEVKDIYFIRNIFENPLDSYYFFTKMFSFNFITLYSYTFPHIRSEFSKKK